MNALIRTGLWLIMMMIFLLPTSLAGNENYVTLPEWLYEVPDDDSCLYALGWADTSNRYASMSYSAVSMLSFFYQTNCVVIKREFWSNRSLSEPDSTVWAVSLRAKKLENSSAKVINKSLLYDEVIIGLYKIPLRAKMELKEEMDEFIFVKKTHSKSLQDDAEWLIKINYNLDVIADFIASSPDDPPAKIFFGQPGDTFSYPDWYFTDSDNVPGNFQCSAANITGTQGVLLRAYQKAFCLAAGALCESFNSEVTQNDSITETVSWCSLQEIRIKRMAIAGKQDEQELLLLMSGKYAELPDPNPHFWENVTYANKRSVRGEKIADRKNTYNRLNKTITEYK